MLIHLLNDGVHLYSDYYRSITSPRPEEMVLKWEVFLQGIERLKILKLRAWLVQINVVQ